MRLRIAAILPLLALFRLSGAPAFEVASIRPHTTPLHTIMGLTISGSRVTMEGYTVLQLVMEAYHLKGWQVSLTAFAGRDDLLSVYYDVVARSPGEGAVSRDDFRAMLQTLLADRFKLSLHRETKELPVYALFPDKNGPKLRNGAADGNCAINVGVVAGGQSYSFANCTVADLVDMLSNGLLDRPVIDKTQLTGKYGFRMVAMPELMNHDQSDPTNLSPFTAVRDLGLRLEAQKATFDMVVVDRFEKPGEN